MKSNHDGFDWSLFLDEHLHFGELPADDVNRLLDSQNSSHREFKHGETIFRAGEMGNTFFLIGDGSVNVELASEGSSSTFICTLYKGDYFGEMSAIDSQNGRAATIVANEDCKLLEIKSKPFQQILKANPELEFELLSMLAARLRHVNDHVLQNTRQTYDTKFSLLSEKLESQSKVVEASLKASQAVFEQTKIRTTEIINAAERGRSRITWVMSTLTAGFTLLLALFSFLGYDKLNTAQERLDEIELMSKSIKLMKIEIDVSKKEVDVALASVSELSASVATVKAKTEELDDAINDSVKAKGILFGTLIPVFMLQVEEVINQKRQSDTALFGRQILESNNDVVTINLLKEMFIKIKDSHQALVSGPESDKEEELSRDRIIFYTDFMYTYIHDDKEGQTENSLAIFLSSYILLTTYAMNEDYARDVDFYHDKVNSTRYPTDGIDYRLNALISSDNDAEVKKMFKLDSEFVKDLKGIEWAKAAYSADRKNRVEIIWAKGS
jgi:CRP-like cAMP-binding protein